MDGERNSRMSPYNTVMNTELKISVRENITIPASNKLPEESAINCNSLLNDLPLNNPYSGIQVLTSPPEERPAHLPIPPTPVPTIPSRNMSTDQFLSLLNQLIITQEPATSVYPSKSQLAIPHDDQKQNFRLNTDYSIEPVNQQRIVTMDDMHTIPYRRESEEKRASLSKSLSVPSLMHLSSQPPNNQADYNTTKYDPNSAESNYPTQATMITSSQPVATHPLPQSTNADPPNLVCGPQTVDQLPPGVIAPIPHSLTTPTPQIVSGLNIQQDTIKDNSTPTPNPHYSLYQLPQVTQTANSTFHQRTHSSTVQPSEDLLGQLDLLRKREQMLQTAKIQLEEKCATLLDKVDSMEAKEHRFEQELTSMFRIRSEQDQKNSQLEQYNQLQHQQLESSRQHVAQLERRVEGLTQQCKLKDEANSQTSELYKKLDAADKMINVFQERLDSSRLQLSQQEALINSLDTRARSAETALVQSQQDSSVLGKDRIRERELYNQELQRVQTELQADKQRREQDMLRVRNQLIQENEKFKDEYNRLREEYENQKNKFDRLIEEFRMTQTELGRKQSFISELEQESRDRQSELGNLKATVSKYESMEDNYKRTIMRQEEDIRHLQHTNNRLHNLGSMQTTFQGQSEVAKFQYLPPSPQIDSPSTYPRTPASGYSRHWADISPDIPHEVRTSSILADPTSSSSTRTTAAAHVWPSDSESDYPEPVSRPPDSTPYRGGYDRRTHPSSSHKEKLNCSFDITYPKESLSSVQHERVKPMTPHSEPRKRMTWITEEDEGGSVNGISDEEKYKLLMSLDQNTFHKSQPYKSSRSSSYVKAEKPFSLCLDKVSEVEEMYDNLQKEKQLLESALNRGSGRTSRQSRQKREDIEYRLEEVMKELGSIRMKLRMLGILKT